MSQVHERLAGFDPTCAPLSRRALQWVFIRRSVIQLSLAEPGQPLDELIRCLHEKNRTNLSSTTLDQLEQRSRLSGQFLGGMADLSKHSFRARIWPPNVQERIRNAYHLRLDLVSELADPVNSRNKIRRSRRKGPALSDRTSKVVCHCVRDDSLRYLFVHTDNGGVLMASFG
jgi:hypothetical protein